MSTKKNYREQLENEKADNLTLRGEIIRLKEMVKMAAANERIKIAREILRREDDGGE